MACRAILMGRVTGPAFRSENIDLSGVRLLEPTVSEYLLI